MTSLGRAIAGATPAQLRVGVATASASSGYKELASTLTAMTIMTAAAKNKKYPPKR